ncbi:MAG TPA: heme lyase NrfEFG subunit NrfE, partial [Rhodobacteraceae bacterium]|nr:heme lyase NrfEFG subunit NrfE [Paracoccaceae bacterium]
YTATEGDFAVLVDGQQVARLKPQKRFYPVSNMPTTEAAIDIGFTRDVYVVIGDAQDAGGYAVRSYIKPFANWIWAGAIIMALGGLLSLTDRRYRVAAGAIRRQTPVPIVAE